MVKIHEDGAAALLPDRRPRARAHGGVQVHGRADPRPDPGRDRPARAQGGADAARARDRHRDRGRRVGARVLRDQPVLRARPRRGARRAALAALLGERGEARARSRRTRSGSTCRRLTWGLGWGALVAAAVGVVWEFRRDRMRAILLALFPLLLFLYLGSDAERYFARWLMPAYPILALFAGVAIAGVARSISTRGAVRAARRRAADRADHGPADRREHAHRRRDAARPTRASSRATTCSRSCRPGTKIVVDAVAIRQPYDLPLLGIERAPGRARVLLRLRRAAEGGQRLPARPGAHAALHRGPVAGADRPLPRRGLLHGRSR